MRGGTREWSAEFLRRRAEVAMRATSSSLWSSKLLVSEESTAELLPSLSSFSELHLRGRW
jgi:hypothetical protein